MQNQLLDQHKTVRIGFEPDQPVKQPVVARNNADLPAPLRIQIYHGINFPVLQKWERLTLSDHLRRDKRADLRIEILLQINRVLLGQPRKVNQLHAALFLQLLHQPEINLVLFPAQFPAFL